MENESKSTILVLSFLTNLSKDRIQDQLEINAATERWPVQMYSKLHNNNWIETVFEKGQCCLIIKVSQLYVIHNDTAIESVCLLGGSGNVKCFYANQSLGIQTVLNKEKTMSKFRIRFASSFGKPSEDCCIEVAEQLKKLITVTEHPSHKGRKPKEYHSLKPLTQLVKDLMDSEKKLNNFELDIADDVLNETVQQCLLDPEFPYLVGKVENILNRRYEK